MGNKVKSKNLTIRQLKADQEDIDIAEQLLTEMAPLEAGYFMRDLGYSFPVTMDSLKKASEKLNIIRKVITSKRDMIDIGSCPKPAGPGFIKEDIEKSTKLEIIDVYDKKKSVRYCLRNNAGELIAEEVIDK